MTLAPAAFVLLSVLATSAGSPRDVGSLASLVLRDQRGRPDSLRAHRGHVVLVTVVHVKRLRKVRGWEEAIHERLGDRVQYLRIADVPRKPAVSYEDVATKLRDRVPDEVSVLIDLEQRWATSLGLDTDQPNLLVFDRAGRLVSSYRGRPDELLVTYVARDLEELLAKP